MRDLLTYRSKVIQAVLVLVAAMGVTGGAMAATVTDTMVERFFVDGINEIEMITSNGFVEVEAAPGSAAQVVVTRESKALFRGTAQNLIDRTEVTAERQGSKLLVHVDFPRSWFMASISAHIQASVPADWQGRLYVKTSNGRVTVTGLGGDSTLRTSNGSIYVDGWQGSLTATTSNGKVQLSQTLLIGQSRISSSNGSITADLTGVLAPVDITTSNGSIYLDLPRETKASLAARTSNGSVDLRGISLTGDVESSRTSLNASINGGGPLLNLRTSNGRVSIEGK